MLSRSLALKISFALRYEPGVAGFADSTFPFLRIKLIDSEGTYLFVWRIISGVCSSGLRPMYYCVVLANWRWQSNKVIVLFFVNVKVRTGGVLCIGVDFQAAQSIYKHNPNGTESTRFTKLFQGNSQTSIDSKLYRYPSSYYQKACASLARFKLPHAS